jgi:hypothetical protein
MFDQQVLDSRQKPWTMAASLTLQCIGVTAVLLYSALKIQPLGPVKMTDLLPPIPRIPAVQVVDTDVARGTAQASSIAARPRAPRTVQRVGGDVLEAQIVERIIPEYPQLAVRMRISGIVRLMGVIARRSLTSSRSKSWLQSLSTSPFAKFCDASNLRAGTSSIP